MVSLKFRILLSLLLALGVSEAFAQYSVLPDSRILLFNDYADTSKWTHIGNQPPPFVGLPLRNGTLHTHIEGWVVSEARTGYAGNFGKVIPPASSTNFAANLRNVAGASIESPVYPNGIGTLYFEAVNSELPVDLYVYLATNMYDNASSSVVNQMLLVESGDLVFNWQLIKVVNLNYSSQGQFYRYNKSIKYSDAAKVKLVRESAFGAHSIDDQFLVVDNIRISPPPAAVEMEEAYSNIVASPDYTAGTLSVSCRVDRVRFEISADNPDIYMVHRHAPSNGVFSVWLTNQLDYVSGSGDVHGVGLEYEGSVSLEQSGDVEYYYLALFSGDYYESPDYTGTGVAYPYPSESGSPAALYADGMGGSTPFAKTWSFDQPGPFTDLPDSRILIFDDYDDTSKWTHSGAAAPPKMGMRLRNGTLHTHSAGWVVSEARTGYAGDFGKVVPPAVLTNFAANLQNVAGAYIESPLYQNGVGIINWEAVNGEQPVDLHVYAATNMLNTNLSVIVDQMLPVESGNLVYNWQQVEVVSLDYTTQGQYCAYTNIVNYRTPVKIRLVRESTNPAWPLVDDQFLVIDNIKITYPLPAQMYNGRELTGTEVSWLGINPVFSNSFELAAGDFNFDAQTNLHACVRMTLNGGSITNLQGGAVLKLQAKESLDAGEWTTIAQYSLTADSFNASNECNLVVADPFALIAPDEDVKTLFLRWVIDLQEPAPAIQVLTGNE